MTDQPAKVCPAAEGMEEVDVETAEGNKHGDMCSVLRFKDVNFLVGKGENQRKILENVNGTLTCGRVLAVMGPSGAGKTTFINVLTLDAFFGTPTGKVRTPAFLSVFD